VGYDIIESALASEFMFGAAFILLIAKIIATNLTLGSGGSGGVFAPSLFMGAMLGASFEVVVNRFFPDLTAPQGAYALVGMAAVFAAGAHAPITAVIILFELTGDYRIILPLMLTVVIATLLSQYMLRGESIYTLKLSRRGVRLKRGRDIDILQGVKVDEVMNRHIEPVFTDTTLVDLSDIFVRTHHHGLMVLDNDGKLWGVVTINDLEEARLENRPDSTLAGEIATTWPHLKVVYPDMTMADVLAQMGMRGLGRLPVVSRDDPYQLLGLIRREDITRAYNLALTRRVEIQQKTKNVQRQYAAETEFVDISLVEEDRVVGQTVAAVAAGLPKDCVLVSIQRNGSLIIPHGDTIFRAGDKITAFTRNQDAQQLFHCLHGSQNT